MQKIINHKQVVTMYAVASLVYFMSYLTRVDYNTVLVEISSAEQIQRSLLSLPLTASFIIYGFGQIVSGWMGDRFNPFKLIQCGLMLSACMNVLLPLIPNPHLMIVFWAINGFAQALIYPPLIKITENYLSMEQYAKAGLFITIGSHAATLLLYLASPIIIAISSWKFVFAGSFACCSIFVLLFRAYANSITKVYGGINIGQKEDVVAANATAGSVSKSDWKQMLITSGLIFIMIAVVMQGFIRDGITTWMPAYLSDIFSIRNELSILTTVVLPFFAIFSSYLILEIRYRFCQNEIKLAGLTFLVAMTALGLLLVFRDNMLISVCMLALAVVCSHAINYLLICLVPVRYKKYGRFSLVVGIINSCTYVGAAISTYGFAVVSENWGWNMSLVIWAIIAVIGACCCFIVRNK